MSGCAFKLSIVFILLTGITLLITSTAVDAGRRRGPLIRECNNGSDNDQDGKLDYPSDPGCYGPFDTTEGGDDVGCCQTIIPDGEDQIFDNFPESVCQGAADYNFYPDKTCREVRYLIYPRTCDGHACGATKTLVVLAEFQGTTVEFPENSVFRGILSEVSSHYQENSFGQVWLTGVENPNDSADVFGKYDVPYSTNCTDMQNRSHIIVNDVIDQADADIDFSNDYDTLFVVASTGTNPYPDCGLYTGFQTYETINTEEGDFTLGVEYIFLESTNGQNFRGYVHELGHHFYLGHGDLLVCPSGSIDDPDCYVHEYFDAFDVMGVSLYGFHFSAIHKEKLGWFYPSNVIEVTESGEYTIHPIELSTTEPQVIKLPRAAIDYFYLEYRQPIGYDAGLGDGYEDGLALIHLSNNDGWYGIQWVGHSILTPPYLTSVGASYVDPFWGHEISVAAMSPESITFDIAFGTPPPPPPQVQLTFEDAHQECPSYSPDGTKIVYASKEDGGDILDIWTMDADGSNRLQLANESAHQFCPSYSPDGTKIVYASREDGGAVYDVWLMDADGSNHVQLMNTWSDVDTPRLSPDGTKITYDSRDDGGSYSDIWIMDADGSNRVQLTTENRNQVYPSFSPDGTRIIYSSQEDGGGPYDIWTMDTDGGNRVQLTYENANQRNPNFSPDGSKVIYGSYEDGVAISDIWMMDADGSNHVQITTENFTQWRPKYSPDGSSIVYSSREDGGVFYDIWMLEL